MSNNLSTQRAAIECLIAKSNNNKPLGPLFFESTAVELEDGSALYFTGISNGSDNRSKFKGVKVAGFSKDPRFYNKAGINLASECKSVVLVRPFAAGDNRDDIEQRITNLFTVEELAVVSRTVQKLVLRPTGKNKSYVNLF